MKGRGFLWGFVALSALAFLLRVVALGDVPLRGDEAFAVLYWAAPPSESFAMAAQEPHPPLTYLAFFVWTGLVGSSEFAVRYLSVLAGMVSLAAVYRIGKALGGRYLGMMGAFLWAVNPYQVWHARDARNYVLWTAISAVAVMLMLRVAFAPVRRDTGRRGAFWKGIVPWAAYVLAEAAAAYTFYLEVFMLAFQNSVAVLWHRRDGGWLRKWAISQAAVLAIMAPWYLQPRLWRTSYGGTASRLNPFELITRALPELTFGETLPDPAKTWLWVPTLALIVGGLYLTYRWSRERFAFLALYMGVPLALLGMISLLKPFFRPRYVIASAPAYTLALAILILRLPVELGAFRREGSPAMGRDVSYAGRLRGLLRWRAGAVATVMVWGLVLALDVVMLWHGLADPAFRKSPEWSELAGFLERHAAPDDVVAINVPDPAFSYYYRGSAEATTWPPTPNPTPEEVAGMLSEAIATYRAVWFIPTTVPYWDSEQVVLHWLDSNAQLVDDLWVDGFRVRQYRRWDASPDEIATRTAIRAGDFGSMVGYEVRPEMLPRGVVATDADRGLRVILFWVPVAPAPLDYTVFVHLIGRVNPETGTPLWAQDDHPPQWGRVRTSAWPAGELLRDVYTLDLHGVPPGDYELRFGMYEPVTGERLILEDLDTGERGDSIPLFPVTVLEGDG